MMKSLGTPQATYAVARQFVSTIARQAVAAFNATVVYSTQIEWMGFPVERLASEAPNGTASATLRRPASNRIRVIVGSVLRCFNKVAREVMKGLNWLLNTSRGTRSLIQPEQNYANTWLSTDYDRDTKDIAFVQNFRSRSSPVRVLGPFYPHLRHLSPLPLLQQTSNYHTRFREKEYE
jgi:hypothetical protein